MSFDFNPPLTLLTFPSTYQTAFSGSSGFGFTDGYGQNGIDSIRFSHSQNYSSLIDGWGTVTTPSMTNVNSLRQKVTENSVDSIFGKGIVTGNTWMFLQATKDSSITYRWLTNSSDFIVAEVKTNLAGDTVKTANYLVSTLSSGLKDGLLLDNNIRVYPNPASDKLFIDGISANSYLVIFDATGKLVSASLLRKDNSNITISSYENGMYFYQAVDMAGNILGRGKFAVAR